MLLNPNSVDLEKEYVKTNMENGMVHVNLRLVLTKGPPLALMESESQRKALVQ
jgi:hypothetical protein